MNTLEKWGIGSLAFVLLMLFGLLAFEVEWKYRNRDRIEQERRENHEVMMQRSCELYCRAQKEAE